MTRTSSKPAVVRRAVRAPLRSSKAFVATVDPWMTSETDEPPVRAIPFRMASSGFWGVESSLNISTLPSRITTKSVNVPLVSTPTLEIDLRDILKEFWDDRSDILDRSLRIALPCECLYVGANDIEAVNSDFAHPGEVLIGGRLRGNISDPLDYPLPLFGVRADLQSRALVGVNAKFNIGPPAGLDYLQIKDRLEDVNCGKIAARDWAFRNTGFAAVITFETRPDFTRMIDCTRRCENQNAVRAIFLERLQGLGIRLVIEFGQGAAGNKNGIDVTGDERNAGSEPLRHIHVLSGIVVRRKRRHRNSRSLWERPARLRRARGGALSLISFAQ